jgi:hypothetical protein
MKTIHKQESFKELLEKFISNNPRNNNQLYRFCLEQGFLPKHATEHLSSLQKQGKIKVMTLSGEKLRQGAFYLNSKNYTNNVAKISVQIQK